MALSPNYAAAPHLGVGNIGTANTARDGSGTIGTVFTASANGSRIDQIVVEATGTTTAGMVRLFIHDGTNARLWQEVPVTAVTPSGSTPAFTATLAAALNSAMLPLMLPVGYSLRASTHNAETFNVFAQGGDF